MPLILRARLAWAHDWVTNPALGAVFQSLPGASFIVNGAAPPPNSALVSAAAELHMTPHWSALAKFDGEFANGSQTYAGTGTLRYSGETAWAPGSTLACFWLSKMKKDNLKVRRPNKWLWRRLGPCRFRCRDRASMRPRQRCRG